MGGGHTAAFSVRGEAAEADYARPGVAAAAAPTIAKGVAASANDFRGREDELLSATVDHLSSGAVVGWFYGRMEFGPRALGAGPTGVVVDLSGATFLDSSILGALLAIPAAAQVVFYEHDGFGGLNAALLLRKFA